MKTRSALLVGSQLLLLTAARAQTPLEDIGFSSATPQPDPDLVVVRERAYGAAGVDLTAYGIGTGPVDYVQSLYFRLYVDSSGATKSTAGRIVFPPEVTILGLVTDGVDLGGSADDGQWTATDQLFGIGSDPDAYSEAARGFDPANAEFVCATSAQTLVFGLAVTGGVDDFRVIVDYGSSFPADVDFDIGFYDLPNVGGAPPSRGYRVGDDANPTVLGSGDFGEVGSLIGVPLTSNTAPTTGCDLPIRPEDSVYMARDTSGDSHVDSFDAELRIPAPELASTNQVGTPVGLAAGPDALLYMAGAGGGFAVIDPRGSVSNTVVIDDLPGSNVDLTGLPGTRDVYLVRDTSSSTFVDRLDVDTFQFVESFPISNTLLATPVAIADGADSLFYVVGNGAGFVAVDPATGDVTNIGLAPPAGFNRGITGRTGTSNVYIVRDAGATTSIDVHDFGSGTTTYDFGTTALITEPVGITTGPNDRLYVVGKGGSFSVFDADTGVELESNACMAFAGDNVDIAFTLPGPAGIYCTAKTNSKGCIPAIGFNGTPSASDPTPFEITAANVINNKFGLVIYGLGANSVPFQGGLLCIQPPIKRTPPVSSGGNPPPNDCSGFFSFDFNAFIQSGGDPNLVPCTSVYTQYWYRDGQDPAGFGTGLTDALQFEIQL